MSRPPLRPPVHIGLTGGIGSGKSTVGALLVNLGAELIDADAIARSLSLPGGAAIPALRAEFGDACIDEAGALDRALMRSLVFANAGAKARLEAILHPLIGREAQAQAKRSARPVVVFDVPLLGPHSHWRLSAARILVVDCSTQTQVARVVQRPGWTEATAQQVVAQQATRELRRSLADAVIHNDGISLSALEDQVRDLWRLWVDPRSTVPGSS